MVIAELKWEVKTNSSRIGGELENGIGSSAMEIPYFQCLGIQCSNQAFKILAARTFFSLFLFKFNFRFPFSFRGFCFQATIGTNGRPSNRTVVFRGFEDGTDRIQIYTDSRSRKVLLLRNSINSYGYCCCSMIFDAMIVWVSGF